MTGKGILLVEDNADDAELTVLAFRKGDVHNVHVVRDGVEALEWLLGPGAEHTSVPAVVLLDLKLPKIDGLDVLKRIRSDERTRYLPVVILTSSMEGIDLSRAYSLGANSYIRKPLDFSELLTAAVHIGKYWLGLNESLSGKLRLKAESA